MNILSFNGYTEKQIYELICNTRNNDLTSFNTLISIFKNKLLMKNDLDLSNDLLSFFTELLLKIPLSKTYSNHKLINYILSSIKKKKYNLAKREKNNIIHLSNSNYTDTLLSSNDTIYDSLLYKEIISSLSNRDKLIILLYYKYGYKEAEIGTFLGVTKQAISKKKNIILKNIQKSFSC